MTRAKASLLAMLAAALSVAMMAGIPCAPRPVVHTAIIREGALVQSVLLSGVVRYRQEQPCVSPKDGRVEKVYAQAGMAVTKGDLLIQLDCKAEEEMLAACIQAKNQRQLLGETAAAFALESQLSLSQMEARARAGIAASRIRAENDGIVENVYIQEGDYVQQGTVLGWTRSSEKCVQALSTAARLSEVRTGAAAVLSTGETLRLQSIGAPSDENAHLLEFVALEPEALEDRKPGESVTVELLCSSAANQALVPLGAVSAAQKIWFVENGRACSAQVDISERNEDFVAVPSEWVGKSVVLAPDETQLTEGCAVKVAGEK